MDVDEDDDDDVDKGNDGDAANESVGTGNDTGLGATWNVLGKALLVTEENDRSDEEFSWAGDFWVEPMLNPRVV